VIDVLDVVDVIDIDRSRASAGPRD